MDEQTCMYTDIQHKDKYYCFAMNLRQWNQLKKKVDRGFKEPYDFTEMRFYIDDGQLEFEGHCCTIRRRK